MPAQITQTQPKRYRFTLRGFLSLPRRLCSPPAAVGKVRSFGLTPIFEVKLEDVLNRKHLPPLSLKDFEEWLLYVEQSVENLYFLLWLREYSAKYERWITKVRTRDAKARRHAQDGTSYVQTAYRVAWSTTTPTSPALALFFSRARETFLVPGAPYELSLPPALLDALAVVNGHPDPAVLAPARAYVENALRASLSRCVRAAYSNVGAYRAACGIAAGIFIILVGTVPALSVNFVRGQSRWERLAILPGLWLGLTVLIASLRGICMMIYIFGDFRQLRKFELVRPSPPASPRESESFEFDDDDEDESGFPTVSAPRRPVRALTSPPKIAIRIPTRTPTLSYGTTSASLTTDVSFSGIGTGTTNSGIGTDSSYTNTSHTHTISISSLKSRGGASSLGLGHRYSNGYTYASSDADTRSVPPYLSDDERGDETDEEDAMSSNASDHGIYISPAMPSPEDDAEDDPAVVNAALALIASGGAEGNTPSPTAGPPPQSSGLPTSAPSSATIKTQASQTVSQTPTASFIPPFSYPDAEPTQRRRSRSHSRSRSGDGARDLEAGICPAPTAIAASAVPTFDFEGLPSPPPPPLSPPAPTHLRTRDPDVYVDISNGLPAPADEKMLASPCSGYNLGLTTGTGTDCDPDSPARWDDVTRLYEKAPGYDPSSSRAGRRSHRPVRLSSLFRLPSLVSLLMSFRPFASSHPSFSSSSSSSSSYTDSFHPRGWRTRCAIESHVPAFGPVTRVLAPVVARAQWEIVVRAAVFAALLGIGVSSVVVALPAPGR